MSDLTEEQARSMGAGPELNHHCAIWMGYTEDCEYHDMGPDCPPMPEDFYRAPSGEPYDHAPPAFSTDWSAAGPLLEAMTASLRPRGERWYCIEYGHGATSILDARRYCTGDTAPLAIARQCAVFVARGVTREEVEGE